MSAEKVDESIVSPASAPLEDSSPVAGTREAIRLTPSTLREKLAQDLKDSADVEAIPASEFKGKEVFKITVKDRKLWSSEPELRKLVDSFGEVIFHAYKDREDKTPYQADDPEFMERFFQGNMVGTDLSYSDSVYVVADQGKVQGFMAKGKISMEDGTQADELKLTAVHPSQEKTGLAKSILKLSVQTSGNILIGMSHTPAAVRNAMTMGESEGFRVYLCGARNGDKNIALGDKERQMVEMASKGLIDKMVKASKVLADLQQGIPPVYISLGELGIPPRQLEELQFSPDDPLGKAFEDMIHWQQDHRPGHCLYGIIVSIRESALE